jgi:hypothetical protein
MYIPITNKTRPKKVMTHIRTQQYGYTSLQTTIMSSTPMVSSESCFQLNDANLASYITLSIERKDGVLEIRKIFVYAKTL